MIKEAQVIGAGAIGVVMGWFLARGGWSVDMVETKSSKLTAGRREGLELNGERQVGGIHFEPFDCWTPKKGALILLCVKTFDNAAVLERINDKDLLPVQNGFDAGLEASAHLFEGIAAFVSECDPHRPAARITRKGNLYLGSRTKSAIRRDGVAGELAGALRAGGFERTRVVPFIGPFKSSKLMYNAAISPLAAAAGVDNGELLRDPIARRLFFGLLRENYSILWRNRGWKTWWGPIAVVN